MSKQATKVKLVKAGLALMRSTGYTASGINQVLAAAEVPKGSFYHHFATKDAFVLEVIRLYAGGEQDRVNRMLEDPAHTPLNKLRRYFRNLIATYGRGGGPITGCLLGNLSLEVGQEHTEIRDLLRQAFDGWQGALAKTIQEAIEAGELAKTSRPDDLAALLVNGWEGAQVRAKAVQSDQPLELFFENAFGMLLKK